MAFSDQLYIFFIEFVVDEGEGFVPFGFIIHKNSGIPLRKWYVLHKGIIEQFFHHLNLLFIIRKKLCNENSYKIKFIFSLKR